MNPACDAPLALPDLMEYWFGELDPEREPALEEHLLGCAHCSARLEEIALLGAGIRDAFRRGALHAVLPPGFVEGLRREGLRMREYRVPAGGSVNCTIGADDDFVYSRLEAPLAGVQRLDLVVLGPGRQAEVTFEDIPFDAAAREVLVFPSAAALKALPAHTQRMRLVAVGGAGARTAIGEYTFVHTPG
jgi:anti-sigma factor RsiW